MKEASFISGIFVLSCWLNIIICCWSDTTRYKIVTQSVSVCHIDNSQYWLDLSLSHYTMLLLHSRLLPGIFRKHLWGQYLIRISLQCCALIFFLSLVKNIQLLYSHQIIKIISTLYLGDFFTHRVWSNRTLHLPLNAKWKLL